MFCVRQPSARGCRFTFVFVYFVIKVFKSSPVPASSFPIYELCYRVFCQKMAHNKRLNFYSLLQDDRCCCGYKCRSDCCSVHTRNSHFRDSLPHLNAVVNPVTCSTWPLCLHLVRRQMLKTASVAHFSVCVVNKTERLCHSHIQRHAQHEGFIFK